MREASEPTEEPTEEPAHRAIASALSEGPWTFVALGPMTNLAAAIGCALASQRNVVGIVVVMGRRLGHRFHPSEATSYGFGCMGSGVLVMFSFLSD